MAWCAMDLLRARFPGAKFILTTRFAGLPVRGTQTGAIQTEQRDAELLDVSGERMERSLVRVFLWWILKRLGLDFPFLLNTQIIRAYLSADVVLSVSGISFVEDRGFIAMYHSAKWIQLPVCLGKPVLKLQQSIGPVRKPYNRRYVKCLLDCVDVIVARGEMTEKRFEALGVTSQIYTFPDLAFVLPLSQSAYSDHFKEVFSTCRRWGVTVVGISPNVVCKHIASKFGFSNYQTQMAWFLDSLAENDHCQLVLIPHACSSGRDDFSLCQSIQAEMCYESSVWVLHTEDRTPGEIKSIIGQCDLFVGSRFHALLAALSMGVPSMAIGWNPKYRELMEWVGLEQYVCDCRDMNVKHLVSIFEHLEQNHVEITQRLDSVIPVLQKLVRDSANLVSGHILCNISNTS